MTLRSRDLSIGYRRRGRPDVVLARALNLCLRPGELVGLLGPNGIGKSTLLSTLGGGLQPLAGQVLLDQRDIARLKPQERARRLSLVTTAAPRPRLMSGYALVALGRHPHTDWLGRLTADDRDIIAWALDAVNGGELAEQPVSELSDGQRQKLMIARALAQQSDIMLLDEPTAFLDLPRRIETMALLKKLAGTTRLAILVSTHDLDLALRNCDRLWLMSQAGIKVGAPEDLALDGSLGATFRAEGIHFDQRRGSFALDAAAGQRVYVPGDGEHAIWLRRALARAGYALDDRPGRIELYHQQNGRGANWHLRINGDSSRHTTIEAALKALERETT